MGFLLRTAFWFSLVLLAIPFGGNGQAEGTPAVGPVDTFMAAREVIGDVASLCERQPEACEVGRAALHTIGVRAREATRIAYDLLEEEPAAIVAETSPQTHASPQADTSIQTGTVQAVPDPIELLIKAETE